MCRVILKCYLECFVKVGAGMKFVSDENSERFNTINLFDVIITVCHCSMTYIYQIF